MAKTTDNYNLPYPESTDTADVPTDMQNLAEKTDEVITELSSNVLTFEVIGTIDD